MAELLKGKPVADAICESVSAEVRSLEERGITPTLAILRVGERADDLSYERGAVKRCAQVGIAVKQVALPENVDNSCFLAELEALNRDETVHGILMFRPLPGQLDEEQARRMLCAQKDVDGCTDGSLAGVFANTKVGFAPCTAEAAMEILRYYGVELSGKRAVVIGRSLVIGRPVAMMLMHQNATVTICHTGTKDVPAVTSQADILIAASGKMESIGAEYVSEKQVIVDVGIGWNEQKQKLSGDVKLEDVEEIVKGVTPVPGGVGAVTTSVLARHVVQAAERMSAAQEQL